MPREQHSAAGSRAARSQRGPDKRPGRDSESESESDPGSDGPRAGPGRRQQWNILCPGCGKPFRDASCLRKHRNSRWLVNALCREAGNKRPRTVVRAAAGSDSEPDAMDDPIDRIMAVGPNLDQPAEEQQGNNLHQILSEVNDARTAQTHVD